MTKLEVGDIVYCREYGVRCKIKCVAHDLCSVEMDKKVLGSTVKIVPLSSLIPIVVYESRMNKGAEKQ